MTNFSIGTGVTTPGLRPFLPYNALDHTTPAIEHDAATMTANWDQVRASSLVDAPPEGYTPLHVVRFSNAPYTSQYLQGLALRQCVISDEPVDVRFTRVHTDEYGSFPNLTQSYVPAAQRADTHDFAVSDLSDPATRDVVYKFMNLQAVQGHVREWHVDNPDAERNATNVLQDFLKRPEQRYVFTAAAFLTGAAIRDANRKAQPDLAKYIDPLLPPKAIAKYEELRRLGALPFTHDQIMSPFRAEAARVLERAADWRQRNGGHGQGW